MYEKFKIIAVPETPGGVQIRGCMFENTCLRELYMTQTITNMLEAHSIQWGNKPLGTETGAKPNRLLTNRLIEPFLRLV
jgi:hypothetical protein